MSPMPMLLIGVSEVWENESLICLRIDSAPENLHTCSGHKRQFRPRKGSRTANTDGVTVSCREGTKCFDVILNKWETWLEGRLSNDPSTYKVYDEKTGKLNSLATTRKISEVIDQGTPSDGCIFSFYGLGNYRNNYQIDLDMTDCPCAAKSGEELKDDSLNHDQSVAPKPGHVTGETSNLETTGTA